MLVDVKNFGFNENLRSWNAGRVERKLFYANKYNNVGWAWWCLAYGGGLSQWHLVDVQLLKTNSNFSLQKKK